MSCDYCWPGNCCGGPNCLNKREPLVKKTDEELAADDRRYFGTSFMRRRADGSMERIDPADIFVQKRDKE